MFSLSKQRVLIISPHLDDEVLGCGGFIQKVKQAGGKIFVQFLTTGDTKDFSRKKNSTMSQRQKEVERVAKYLHIDDYDIAFYGDEHHLKLDVVGAKVVIHSIERSSRISVEKIKPHILCFPSVYSYNQDHQIAARATHAALRPADSGLKHFVPTVLAYEVPADRWSLEVQHVPNFFVPLTKSELSAKLTALRFYRSQTRPFPNPRAAKTIESLARLRGALCASQYAEAFIAYRLVL